MLNALINYVRDELHAKKVICSCFSENAQSRKLLLSCGLSYTSSSKITRAWDGKEFVLELYELNF